MNQTLFFLLYYATVLLLGAMLITGWFTITRGEWYKNPDDTPYWSGKLFSPWLRFWNQENGTERFYYKGQELENMAMQVSSLIGIKDCRIEDKRYMVVNDTILEIFLRKRQYIFNHLKVVVSDSPMPDSQNLIFLYRDYPTYKFPHWVRAPLATCLYCHGSIYGSLVWWLTAWIFKTYLNLPFEWNLIAIFWVPFIISQSFVSPYLNKKL